jgi:hypothetical protein
MTTVRLSLVVIKLARHIQINNSGTPFGEDWLGWTIFVFIIVTIIIIVIKVLILYPGLTELKCVDKQKDSPVNDDLERRVSS